MRHKRIVISSIPLLTPSQEAGMLTLLTDLSAKGITPYFYSQYHQYASLSNFVLKKIAFSRLIYKYHYYKTLCIIDKDKWKARLKISWRLTSDTETELFFISRVKQAIKFFCHTKPLMFVCWNPNCWEHGIMADVARSMGIKVGGIEWGLLPDTFIFDNKGTLASSEIFNREIIYPDDKLVEKEGEMVYNVLKSESISLYKQQVKELPASLLTKDEARTNILILGIHEVDSAAYPANHPDRKALLPFHESSYDQALAFAQADSSYNVIFKPHPSLNKYDQDLQVQANMWVFNIDPDYLINWADIVVCTGSKMELSVMLKNKPLINVGAGLLYHKGCSYQIESPSQLNYVVSEAKLKGITPQQLQHFKKVLGYLKHYYLYSYATKSNNHAIITRFLEGI